MCMTVYENSDVLISRCYKYLRLVCSLNLGRDCTRFLTPVFERYVDDHGWLYPDGRTTDLKIHGIVGAGFIHAFQTQHEAHRANASTALYGESILHSAYAIKVKAYGVSSFYRARSRGLVCLAMYIPAAGPNHRSVVTETLDRILSGDLPFCAIDELPGVHGNRELQKILSLD